MLFVLYLSSQYWLFLRTQVELKRTEMNKIAIIATLLLAGCSDTPIENTDSENLAPEVVVGKGDSPDPDPEPQASNDSEVPYFFQYSNMLHPGSSCQNTSVAMVLSHLGWQGVPDDITSSWGKDYAQSPHNLSNMFNTIAIAEDLSGRLVTNTNGSLDEFRNLAATGSVLIVHGYFTGYGHVLVVTDYDGTHYTANDPAGVWRGTFKGGYERSGATDGNSVRYNKDSFEAAIGTSDGYSSLPLWYHRLESERNR